MEMGGVLVRVQYGGGVDNRLCRVSYSGIVDIEGGTEMPGQMIIVYVIGVAVGAYLVYRIYRVVAGKRRGGGCPNCCSGGKNCCSGESEKRAGGAGRER